MDTEKTIETSSKLLVPLIILIAFGISFFSTGRKDLDIINFSSSSKN